MSLIRIASGALALFLFMAPADAQECAFGESDGERGGTYEGVPYYWIVNAYAGGARAIGTAAVNGYGISTTANTIFEIPQGDAVARQSKTYRSFIEVNYFGTDPQSRPLKARLDVAGSAHEFTVEERVKSGSTGTIDLALLYPALIEAIRNGELARLTILDGEKTFIDQYFRGSSLKIRFVWMEGEMDRITAEAEAGNCPEAPKQAPISGGGSVHSF